MRFGSQYCLYADQNSRINHGVDADSHVLVGVRRKCWEDGNAGLRGAPIAGVPLMSHGALPEDRYWTRPRAAPAFAYGSAINTRVAMKVVIKT